MICNKVLNMKRYVLLLSLVGFLMFGHGLELYAKGLIQSGREDIFFIEIPIVVSSK